MPALTEFTLTLQLRRDEESSTIWTVFRFATIREFRSFQYQIQVDDRFDAAERTFEFRLSGVQAPKNLMPSSGTALRELRYPDLRGEYTVRLAGARHSERFGFAVADGAITLGERPDGAGVRVDVEKGIEKILP